MIEAISFPRILWMINGETKLQCKSIKKHNGREINNNYIIDSQVGTLKGNGKKETVAFHESVKDFLSILMILPI